LHIRLPFNKVINKSKLGYFSEQSMRKIKDYIYGIFYAQFIDYMYDKVVVGGWNVKYAIVNFIDKFDMQWNPTNYETLRKIFDRYRNPVPNKSKSYRQKEKSSIPVH
jgi:hypothetical protein